MSITNMNLEMGVRKIHIFHPFAMFLVQVNPSHLLGIGSFTEEKQQIFILFG